MTSKYSRCMQEFTTSFMIDMNLVISCCVSTTRRSKFVLVIATRSGRSPDHETADRITDVVGASVESTKITMYVYDIPPE
jgi:hypothetical protein